jgi:fatty acid-binding protein DegV
VRAGRGVGGRAAFLGGLLHLKPILTVKDGETHPVTRVRSRAKAIDALYQLCAEGDVTEVAVLHTTTPVDAETLVERVRQAAPGAIVHTGRFGPVLGVHGGPGMLGLAAVARE